MKQMMSRRVLRRKALELMLPLHPDFRASTGWIKNFLHRHEINLTNTTRSVEPTKSKVTKNKNGKVKGSHIFTIERHSTNQYGTSCLIEQNNIYHSSESSQTPLAASSYHLEKIGKPRKLLKQKINWKVCVKIMWLYNSELLVQTYMKKECELRSFLLSHSA